MHIYLLCNFSITIPLGILTPRCVNSTRCQSWITRLVLACISAPISFASVLTMKPVIFIYSKSYSVSFHT